MKAHTRTTFPNFSSWTKRALLLVLLSLAGLVLAACGGGAPSNPSSTQVTLREWAVELQDTTLAAGTVTFEVTNSGTLEHNFIIEGVDEGLELVFPGDTATLQVELAPGEYKVICSLAGHEEAGMVTTLVVQE